MTADDMRALRKRLGMTQAQLAVALDLTAGSIANYEGGRGPYKIPRVVALACESLLKRNSERPIIDPMRQREIKPLRDWPDGIEFEDADPHSAVSGEDGG